MAWTGIRCKPAINSWCDCMDWMPPRVITSIQTRDRFSFMLFSCRGLVVGHNSSMRPLHRSTRIFSLTVPFHSTFWQQWATSSRTFLLHLLTLPISRLPGVFSMPFLIVAPAYQEDGATIKNGIENTPGKREIGKVSKWSRNVREDVAHCCQKVDWKGTVSEKMRVER